VFQPEESSQSTSDLLIILKLYGNVIRVIARGGCATL
jgi:hypothetical protein